MYLKELNLRLFDGEGGAPAAESAPAEAEAIVTSNADDARRADFEKLIKNDYKDLFEERTQKIINDRFRQMKTLEAEAEKAKALNPVMEMLAGKYGVEAGNVDAVVKAIQEDSSYYEDEAAEKGLTVEQLKAFKKIERENAEFKRMLDEQQQRAHEERTLAQWQQQADACKRYYPGFDLQNEVTNPETGQRYLAMLRSGVDVQTAYEVIHKDELIGGAMQYAAQSAQQKTVNDIRSRGMRPPENGANGAAAAVLGKPDPRTWTKKDREEISRRVKSGERIVL